MRHALNENEIAPVKPGGSASYDVNAHVEDFVQRLADLQAKGLGVSAMARELGVSREAIYKRRRGARTWAVNS